MVLVRRGVSPSLAGLAVLIVLLVLWMASQDVVRGTLRERTFDLLLPLLPRSEAQGPGEVLVVLPEPKDDGWNAILNETTARSSFLEYVQQCEEEMRQGRATPLIACHL